MAKDKEVSKPLLQSTTQVNLPDVHWVKGVTDAVSNPLVLFALLMCVVLFAIVWITRQHAETMKAAIDALRESRSGGSSNNSGSKTASTKR